MPTRNDVRILTDLRAPFKAENFDYRSQQLTEVEALKRHLASSNLNVSAEVLYKAIVLPEEEERAEQATERHYPKIGDLLFVNPFAKPKKKKKGKKRRK